MKKKLLLVGVAAMGLLAVGVGATSTFAWYAAASKATIKYDESVSGQLQASETELSLESVKLVITISPTDWGTAGGGAANTKVELTNSTGTAVGAVVNEAPLTEGIGTGTHKVTNTLDIDVKVHSDSIAVFNSTNVNAALKGKSFNIPMKANGNVVFVTTAGDPATGADDDATLVLTFGSTISAAAGTGVITGLSLSSHNYAVRTNNENGLEAGELVNSGAFENSHAYKLYDVLKHTDNNYYVCKGDYTSSASPKTLADDLSSHWEQFKDDGTEPVYHSLDKISIEANTTGLEPTL